jgi:SAM-dependent methyltransferase
VVEYIVRHWILIVQVGLGIFYLGAAWICLPLIWGAPWIPAQADLVKKMLQQADVQPGQKVVDLGAGDGRVVIAAAHLPGVQAVGVEIDPVRCLIANVRIALLGLRSKACIQWGNMFSFDLSDADVVTLYLWPSTNRRLTARLAEQLRPGAKVISHHFPIATWTPIAVDRRERIFVYEIGNTELDIRAILTQKEKEC